MASHMCGAEPACGANSYVLQLPQTSNEVEVVVEALLHLHKDASWNSQELSAIAQNYCENIGESRKFCEALVQKHLEVIKNQLLHEEQDHPLIAVNQLLNDLACVSRRELPMKERLQSFDNSLVEKINCIDVWKKMCAVFFTAAAAFSAAAAAANANSNTPAAAAASAASILFGAFGKWTNFVLKKRESAVKKHKEIVRVMIKGTEISIKHLTKIHDFASRLRLDAESTLGLADDDVNFRNKVVAMKKSFQVLQREADEYSMIMKHATEDVHRTINTQSDN